MDYAPHLAQFRRLLAQIESAEAREADMLAEPFHMAPDIYWRPERHRLETDRLFRRAPLLLGHAGMLPRAGDMLALDVIGQPLLLVRGRDGEIRGFLNVCRHRGTRLCNGEDVQRRSQITCPYHNWVYDLDGRLKHVPLEEGFPGLDRVERGLRRIPLGLREGLIFGVVDPDAPMELDGFLAGLDHDFRIFGFRDMPFFARAMTKRKTNWKLIMDAFLESYHIQRLHKNTIAPFFTDNRAVFDRVGPHLRNVVARLEFPEIARLPEAEWDPRRHSTFAYLLFPNTILVLHPDYTSILTMYPTAPDETLFSHVMLTPHAPRNADEAAHWQRSFELIEGGVFQAEDLFISEQAQIGMASGANRTMIYGRFERGIRIFHETLDEWLGTRSVVSGT